MQSDLSINIIILAGVGFVLLFLFVTALKTKNAEAKKEKEAKTEDKRLYESKEDIPKLPRNETLYNILKNSSLSVNNIGFDPNYVFDEVASLLRNDLHTANVEVLFDIDPAVPVELIGSPKRLSRVLINFIENAVEFSDEGIVTMQVAVGKNNGVDCRLQFTIRDQGRGMEAEEVDALLIDPALREQDGKTPYGCYVSNAIIESEGGTLRIESTPAVGTTVTFDMVFKVPQTHKAETRQRPSKACADLKIAVGVSHTETADVLKKHLQPYVAEVMTIIADGPLSDAELFDGYDMVILEQRLSDRGLSYALKGKGIWLIVLQSIIETPTAGHMAADYQLSLPFTHEHLAQMLVVFYGEELAPASETLTKANAPARFDTFVSDADIPVTANISKKDFAQFVGAKLLIVEDNPINQRVIKGLLGDSGIHLYFAENGLEALDVISEEAPFDLVLMDINMPVLDGIETTRRIRAEHHFDTMPIVAFTGLNLKEQIDRMQEAGMNAHMAKPLNIGRVYSVFNHFLPKSAPDAAA